MIIKKSRIVAADEDLFDDESADDSGDFVDTLDDVAEDIQDIQDDVTEIDEDDVNIEVDNNIEGHYIAECELCHGIFISATVESDQEVEKVTGVCPLCEKQSDQYLKWIVKGIKSNDDDDESNGNTFQ